MCGIVGIISLSKSLDERKNTLHKMLQAQAHRGPDAQQDWHDATCSLGHNRLSIIDLSEEANQPMHSHCGRYVVVFNGEIYNYIEIKAALQNHFVFKTQSDTEVLLSAYIHWGNSFLDKLNGMFSIAIWDKIEQKLFIARDRFGVKPFYFYKNEEQFVFASEIKTLFAAEVPKLKNDKVWSGYLVNGTYGLPDETFWKNIYQLSPGHFAELSPVNKYDFQPKKWYNFEDRIHTIPQMNANTLKEEYSALLDDAIQLRFRADVPLGMNVSGGLDSSTLIALIHKNLPSKQKIEAFTFYCNDTNYDELPWVNDLLKDKPYHLNKVLLEVNKIPQLIEESCYYQDEPFGGFPTLAYSQLFKSAREKGIKVLLDGQGMDEAWAGYDYYHNNSNSLIQGTKSSPVKPEVLDADFNLLASKEVFPTPFSSKLQNLQYRDIFYTKIPRALRFNDRISMQHGTELREPFLDYRLVELAFAQPDSVKFDNGNTKWMLRQISQQLLGNKIALAPKRALQTPQREWMANELETYVQERISEFSNFDFVNKNQVQKIWEEYKKGNQENSFYLWQWINLSYLR
ncbi:asparagine synthase (glutamine-hydrolyzing) [Flavobacterium sp. F372]|uniref:asparagine synthase (glutamine-hydrolyzing) n=1 Tax=Flavobacterium bernardetii TaxID=2813823 RepID=A0ABR7IU92_9FLAO|nr:asparagine synthase (glutamine-hydrolyzing) [Flavobacterium bernardetii]MBC5833332.1 asparagine synthase (glutamine-hydrolyzing) [Flavobacterium bernardetii]NHF68564.1 asparagine synthase (glutamine-hydrolyzing) [Flavobacterium bernardetii]